MSVHEQPRDGNAIDRVLFALRERGEVKNRGKGWKARCPAHDDNNPSLDIDQGDNGNVLLCCRSAKCKCGEIVKALGLTERDLFDSDRPGRKLSWDERTVTAYDYHDEHWKLLFQCVRLRDPKDFRQRQPNGKGGWDWNLKGVRRVLYRLPELLAAHKDRPVFVTEGEKDADNVSRCGLTATTNPMGAGKWSKNYSNWFRGHTVYILAHNDDPGRKHAEEVLQSISHVAKTVRVIQFTDLPEKGDVSDWINEQRAGQAEGDDWLSIGDELLRFCKAAPSPRQPQVATAAPPVPPSKPPAAAPAPTMPSDGKGIILEYYRERYRPIFKVGNTVHCEDGSDLFMNVATAVPTSLLLKRLEAASNAPTKNGLIDGEKLPTFFTRWAKTAWGDLIDSLSDEDAADLGTDTATAEKFKQLVRDALFAPLTLGDVIGDSGVTQVERRSVIGWCVKFGVAGPYRSIRDYRIWCKRVENADGELVLKVTLRHELFAQLRADQRLVALTATKWARRASRYGVGSSSEDDRPHGEKAVLLSPSFLAEITAGVRDEADEICPQPKTASTAEGRGQKKDGQS